VEINLDAGHVLTGNARVYSGVGRSALPDPHRSGAADLDATVLGDWNVARTQPHDLLPRKASCNGTMDVDRRAGDQRRGTPDVNRHSDGGQQLSEDGRIGGDDRPSVTGPGCGVDVGRTFAEVALTFRLGTRLQLLLVCAVCVVGRGQAAAEAVVDCGDVVRRDLLFASDLTSLDAVTARDGTLQVKTRDGKRDEHKTKQDLQTMLSLRSPCFFSFRGLRILAAVTEKRRTVVVGVIYINFITICNPT
jgi:hypothetical protein